MTIEKFYETLQFIDELNSSLKLQTHLEAIRETLNSLVSAPAHPQHQSSLASALTVFTEAANELRNLLTPSQMSSIAELGGEEFFDSSIAEKVKDAISTNAMTPSVARDFVQDLASRREQYLSKIKRTLTGLTDLGVSSRRLEPGDADLAFLIPRDLFKNELGLLAKELIFINRAMTLPLESVSHN
jgi:hypothetical protein